MNSHTTGFHALTEKFELCTHPKQIVPCERTAEELSFELWNHKISSSDLKVKLSAIKIDIPYESFDKNVLFDSKVKMTLFTGIYGSVSESVIQLLNSFII